MNEFYCFINGRKNKIKFLDENTVSVNDKSFSFSINEIDKNYFNISTNDKSFACKILSNSNNTFEIFLNNSCYLVDCKTKIEQIAEEITAKGNSESKKNIRIYAPMPGLILKIFKQDGEIIKKGEPVLILEAMKMENEILSPSDGSIVLSGIKEGDTIEKNTILFEIKNLLFEKKY